MYKKVEKLKELRKVMEGGVQEEYQACQGIVSQKQLNVWSKANPRIGRYRKALAEKCGGKRNSMVVDSLFKEAVKGNIGAIAIWLKFKMGWKDNPMIDQSQHIHKTNVYLDSKALEENARSNRIKTELSTE